MKGNSILNRAKYSENTDEWYTDYKTVEEELSHYEVQFYDKVILCNCDDPYESAFSKYFLRNFNVLKLKKLICTSYVIFAMEEPEIALPPHTQKRIVLSVIEKSTQALFTSHSPYVLEEFEPEQILVISKNEGMLVATPAGMPPTVKTKKYRDEFRRRFCESLLARRVLITEGRTEYDVYSTASRKMQQIHPEKSYNNYQLYTGYPLIVENSLLDTNYASYITEIVGNTTQDSTDLTDIRSVGALQGDGTYKVDIIASNQNGSQTQTKSIYLPQPLRMVRGYSDRLYWDDTLGKYCIEQNVAIFKMSEFTKNINNQGDGLELCTGFIGTHSNMDTTYCDFCNILPSYSINWKFPYEGIYYQGGGAMYIAVSRDKANNMTELKQWCIDNNFTCYVKYKNPVIVETDITDKILFNTYANYTKVITDEKEVVPTSMSGNFAIGGGDTI